MTARKYWIGSKGPYLFDDANTFADGRTHGLAVDKTPVENEDVIRKIDLAAYAPADAAYLVLALDGDLTAERVFTLGNGLDAVDGGANGNYTVTVDETELNHDALSGFVADEHVAHLGVVLTAGNGLTGGGNISASRTFAVGAGTGIAVAADSVALDINALTTDSIAAGDFIPFADITETNTPNKITFANFEAALNHDALNGFVANEHIDWTAATQDLLTTGKVSAEGLFVAPAVSQSLSSDQNDYAIGESLFLRLSATTPVSITGFAAGSNGRMLWVVNNGTNAITLVNQSASSTAANRFVNLSGGDYVLANNDSVLMVYDGTATKWRVFQL